MFISKDKKVKNNQIHLFINSSALDELIQFLKEQEYFIATLNKKEDKIVLGKTSFQKICKLGNKTPQQVLKFNFIKESINKTEGISENEDSFYEYQKLKEKPRVIDSDDVDTNFQLKQYQKENGKVTTNINNDILKKLKDNFIAQNYYTSVFYWEIPYLLLMVLGVMLFYHQYKFEQNGKYYCTIYSFNELALGLFIVISAIQTIVNFYNDKSYHNCSECFNLQILICLIFNLFILHFSDLILSKELMTYLREEDYFNYLYYGVMANLLLILFINFKMKEFFGEYMRLVPIKYSVISNKDDNEIVRSVELI